MKRRPKAIDDLAELTDRIQEHAPILATARDDLARAKRNATNEAALTLQPRHKAAVRRIADALENLSRALAEEADLHDELRRTAPLAESKFMPDMHSDLHDMALSKRGSRASEWARKARTLKILE